MIKQTLFLTMPVSLSLKDHQMVISLKESDDKVKRAIEDIGFVIIENPIISITIPLLNELVENNVSVIFCNNKQMPQSMLLSLDSNRIQGENFREQISIKEVLKKQLWKQVIEYKIKNQSLLLNKLGKSGNMLKPFYTNVKAGDSDNREGLSARKYWKELFGKDFSRERMGAPPNNLLN
jgi:CRISP-associated protein Cas1